jgi:ssDNA-binding Zn-finger/Zn-ribbon topoisomerase 1
MRKTAAIVMIIVGFIGVNCSDIINNWLFHGYGGWLTKVIPIGIITCAIFSLNSKEEPKKCACKKHDYREPNLDCPECQKSIAKAFEENSFHDVKVLDPPQRRNSPRRRS